MKHIANFISATRIILLPVMVCFYKNDLPFVSLYIACGLSDILDGYVARRTNTQSAAGAMLDSVADFLLFGAAAGFMLLRMGDRLAVFLPWIIPAAVLRGANLIVAAYKYRLFIILHTWGNKLTGLLLFLIPIEYIVFDSALLLWPVCLIALLSALEEGAIHLTSKELDVNRQSVFVK